MNGKKESKMVNEKGVCWNISQPTSESRWGRVRVKPAPNMMLVCFPCIAVTFGDVKSFLLHFFPSLLLPLLLPSTRLRLQAALIMVLPHLGNLALHSLRGLLFFFFLGTAQNKAVWLAFALP
ncbi:hypothetical protein QBC42DRAFT_263457 [Cladorrhinum samala]|uniref:Uncharacterized protein n=1 Tax=Cladorrhinum samala TaxID=585594 RepID=A0AAV9HU96_9PEZI|nr:hypothetical protein QBC42DRAFT_263457 [Cladorrhinum samala]